MSAYISSGNITFVVLLKKYKQFREDDVYLK
jgi:hypothetical protein